MGAAGIRRNVNPEAIQAGVLCMTAGKVDSNADSRFMQESDKSKESEGDMAVTSIRPDGTGISSSYKVLIDVNNVVIFLQA
jgi:hypothetical protein